ncbi:hypothetical protein C8R46DRAFT_378731 [Mycena filopes]|nr:hypothetical protein C8R46DRAFT_378731 [Mycena filopes]
MSLLDALNARIDELSSTIELQKRVLKGLETRRSNLLHEVNAIRDPMARLPLEISSEIFMQCLTDSPGPGCDSSPTTLLRVCQLWNEIASSTPSLWTTLHLSAAAHAPHLERLQATEINKISGFWFGRAKNQPLSVSVHGSLQLLFAVEQYAYRIGSLDLRLASRSELRILPFPSLTRLKLEILERHAHTPFDIDCLEILRAAPCVVDCEIAGPNTRPVIDNATPLALTHHHLQHLRLGRQSFHGTPNILHTPTILHYLTLPALQTLFISYFDDLDPNVFGDFLLRSSPVLRSLHLITYESRFEDFPMLPHLTDLTLEFMNDVNTLNLFNDRYLNLRNLTIRAGLVNVAEYVGTLRVQARRPRLRSLRVVHLESLQLDEGTAAALQELVLDGMQIEIQNEEGNDI